MPDHMRTQSLENANLLSMTGQQLPKSLSRERATASSHKQVRTRAAMKQVRTPLSQVILYSPDGRFSYRDDALLVALPGNTHEAKVQLNIRHSYVTKLRNT